MSRLLMVSQMPYSYWFRQFRVAGTISNWTRQVHPLMKKRAKYVLFQQNRSLVTLHIFIKQVLYHIYMICNSLL